SGAEWRNRLQVSETGRVTVPEIGTFRVAGRTEFEIADDIENLLSPHILKTPTVNVVVVASTEKVFSISGAIAASGRYQLIQSDFRILEAIAQAGGVPQTGIDYVYVVRKISDEDLEEIESQLGAEMRTEGPQEMMPEEAFKKRTEPFPYQPMGIDEYSPGQTEQRQQELIQAIPPAPISEEDGQPEPTQPEPEVITPPEPEEPEPEVTTPPEPKESEPKVAEPSVSLEPEPKEPKEPKPTPEQEWDKLLESIRPMTEIAMPEEGAESKKKLKIIRENGKFQLIPVDQKTAGQERTEEPRMPEQPWRTSGRQGWKGSDGQHQEVIQVDLKALQGGDMTQNIVIRSGDYIQVPYNDIGVFYVMGQVSRPGPYSLQGQRMTLKQVISVAGPLSPLANMNCCDITRRIGRDKEVTCRLNLQKLIEGSQPDIFIKPNDIINIGSHPVARWVAVVRQSFRATYGFGFVYDRNLADKDFGH
ncbi:MAG: polysaccharide biosynthesis/export family protein, partial [Sedimentisphaerales bacterium]|nr:polysaccharide biosynthesis/export family protein [Sedimentisphaerales bacterium]